MPSPMRLMASNFSFQLNTCSHSPYVTSSLARRWVCHSQLLLAVTSTIILRSESHGTHDHILLSDIRDSQPGVPGSHIYITPGTGWPSYTLRHWIFFSLCPVTHRATVDPASTRVLSNSLSGLSI
jgi:hypothetical protein